MNLLAAAVPVAVLVLAWDEAAPAVRALVEATETTVPALDSVVVLVPAAGEPTQEEFLPLATEPAPLAAAADDASATAEIAPAGQEDATPLHSPPSLLPLPLAAVAPLELPAPGNLVKTLPLPAEPPVAAPAPLAWSAVRVLHLSSFSLPELTRMSSQTLPRPSWQRSAVPPAAPYLGSQSEAADSETSPDASPAAAQPGVAARRPDLVENVIFSLPPTLAAAAQPKQPPLALPMSAPDYLLAEPLLPALDAEADLAPILPNDLANAEPTATEASVAAAPKNAQAGWSEALASLRAPLPIDEPTPATDLEDEASYYAATGGAAPAATSVEPAALRPVKQPFEAPDLNFQVIQYARFAVPVALAQMPFAAIYAPAWPTWLAAQELRQRTRQPLVLHVATLAAGANDSLETATGWQAELQRQALHRADLILAETPELAQRLRHDLGLSSNLVRTVPAANADAVAQALRTARLRPSGSAG